MSLGGTFTSEDLNGNVEGGLEIQNSRGRVFQEEGLGRVEPPGEESALSLGEEEVGSRKSKACSRGKKGDQPGKGTLGEGGRKWRLVSITVWIPFIHFKQRSVMIWFRFYF